MKKGDLYFSLVGPDEKQWRLTVYEWVPCGAPPKPEDTHVRPKSGPHYFDTLDEALMEMKNYAKPTTHRL